jgi:hypothetical protein
MDVNREEVTPGDIDKHNAAAKRRAGAWMDDRISTLR